MKLSLNTLKRDIQPFLTEPEKQGQTIIFTTGVFLIILLFLGIRPVIVEDIRLKQELDDGRDVNRKLTQKVSNLNKAIENTNQIRSDLSLVDKSLPENKDLPTLLTNLNLIFGSNNVALEEINFDGPKPSKNPNVFMLPFTVQASGSYENILTTLEDLEKNPRQMDIAKISIEIPQKGDKKFLRVSIDIETYFLKKIYT